MTEVTFEVSVRPEDAVAFATLSGDWNPLHTDEHYAAGTQFGRTLLHGAFSAGIVSRLAGMHIPGKDCLLHGMQLKFLQPIFPPARLSVKGTVVHERGDTGRVAVDISDADTGRRYVEGWYQYGRYQTGRLTQAEIPKPAATSTDGVILVTGSSGGLGKAVLARLGSKGRAFSREDSAVGPSPFHADRIHALTGGSPIAAIVHCGWPGPDNTRLTKLDDIGAAVDYNVSEPLKQSIALSRLLLAHGTSDAMLLLVGSTAADPGRHNFRMPLYTVAKSVIPTLCRILAVELGSSGRRCAAAIFDVIDTGMNRGMSAQARLAHESRSPAGRLPTAEEAADQLGWMIANRSFLMSGATITLSGGALP